tara:strand:+ start:53 stop:193 length:141 start_codon:yes stop_codon:yes gene_type:complete
VYKKQQAQDNSWETFPQKAPENMTFARNPPNSSITVLFTVLSVDYK